MADEDTGSETTESSTDTDTSSSDGKGSETQPDTKQQQRTEKPAKSTESKPADETSTGDTTKLQKALESERAARKEAEKRAKAAGDDATARATAAEEKHQQTLDGIATALGFKKDETPPDPAALQSTISSQSTKIADLEQKVVDTQADADAKLRARDVELAAWREASKQGLNAAMLLDLRSTERALSKFDPAADDFPTVLTAAIKDLAKDNPALRINREVSAADAGIGTAGGRDDSTVTPGTGRLRAAYST